jgi:S1-C subfamily serine protease
MQSMMRLMVVMAGVGAWAAAGAAVAPAWDGSIDAGNSAGMSAVGTNSRTQGYLGVDIRDVGDDQVSVLKLKEARGAEVIHVDHDGPAGKVGLREHDVILQMNGTMIEGEDQLRKMLRETPAGRTATLIISRDGQQQTITTRLANKQEVERQAWEGHWTVPVPSEEGAGAGAPAATTAAAGSGSGGGSGSGSSNSSAGTKGQGFFSSNPVARGSHNLIATMTGSSYTGALVENMGPQLAEFFGSQGAGVLVHSVDADSPAAKAGLRAGDVVVRANSVKMASSSDWMKIVRENRGKSVEVVVLRDKKEQTLTLIPDGKKRTSVDYTKDRETAMVVMRNGFSFY